LDQSFVAIMAKSALHHTSDEEAEHKAEKEQQSLRPSCHLQMRAKQAQRNKYSQIAVSRAKGEKG
jgi:hypothetical protein